MQGTKREQAERERGFGFVLEHARDAVDSGTLPPVKSGTHRAPAKCAAARTVAPVMVDPANARGPSGVSLKSNGEMVVPITNQPVASTMMNPPERTKARSHRR